jgi:hypothetical protein
MKSSRSGYFMHHGRELRFLRCAYHANVMNTFESASSATVRRMIGMLETSLSHDPYGKQEMLGLQSRYVITHFVGARS